MADSPALHLHNSLRQAKERWAIFLGAGSSYDYGIPTMVEIANILRETINADKPAYGISKPTLHLLRGPCPETNGASDWNIEDLLTRLYQLLDTTASPHAGFAAVTTTVGKTSVDLEAIRQASDELTRFMAEMCDLASRKHTSHGSGRVDYLSAIFLARIKEVYVGIQDPDPTVARKGVGYLIRKGVTVHMFDRDLQEVIEKENKKFLEQATERAAEVKQRPAKVVLSPLEDRLPEAELADLSGDALEAYRRKAGIADSVESDDFHRRLLRQGILKREKGTLAPTGFGFLLFGKGPRTAMRQAGLLGLIQYPDGKPERREFDEPAVLIPDQVEQWLKDKLPNVFDRDQADRQERPALPFEMIREAVANALIHRDYGIEGAKCQIVVTSDTVTVKSPGEPPPPITLKQLQDFSAPMLSRNPELHFVFARMGMAEEQGLGLASLKNRAKELGLPPPRYIPFKKMFLDRAIVTS